MKKILVALAFLSVVAGCGKEDCAYEPCATQATALEVAQVRDYLQRNNITATQHCSGMFYTLTQQGNGKQATGCSNVTVRYKGMLTNGTVFDETRPGQPPANFDAGRLIPGFTNALIQLKSGGRLVAYIPPSLGYGSQQVGTIPANSILVFEMELVAVQ